MSSSTRSSRTSTSPKPSLRVTKKSTQSKSRSRRTLPKILTNDNLASDQKAVFDWYEKHQYNEDAGEIFSLAWEYRLSHWRKNFSDNIDILCNKLEALEYHPERLEFGIFFRAHPVAAFSLWNVLHASYNLDRRICGKSTKHRKKIAEWQNLRPLEYLMSDDIISTWEKSLIKFGAEVGESTKKSTNLFQKETVLNRLYAMAEEVHDLEDGLRIVESIFELNRKELDCSYWMLDIIREQVNRRLSVIEKYITDH